MIIFFVILEVYNWATRHVNQCQVKLFVQPSGTIIHGVESDTYIAVCGGREDTSNRTLKRTCKWFKSI